VTDRTRVAITAAIALVLGVTAYLDAIDLDPPGALDVVWRIWRVASFALAIFGVFLVYRWWALLAAIAPVAVWACIYNLTDLIAPQSDSEWDFSDHPLLYCLYTVVAVFLQGALLAVGLLLRFGWERAGSHRRARAGPSGEAAAGSS
jgi:hypothetical protein